MNIDNNNITEKKLTSEEGGSETKSYPSIQMWKRKMTTRWEYVLYFTPTPDHLDEWTFLVNDQIRLTEYLAQIKDDDLLAIIKQASRFKGKTDDDSLKHAGPGEPVLKSFWKELIDFPPTKQHLALLQEKIDKDLGIDRLIGQMTRVLLMEIIEDVANRLDKAKAASRATKE